MEYGKKLGQMLSPSTVVALSGDLGAGKTTLIKGIAAGYAGIPIDSVSSPTFTYLHEYTGSKTLHHFDLYRLKGPEEFLAKGFDEHLYSDTLCLIEWSEKIAPLLPEKTIHISLKHDGEARTIEVS